MTQAILFEFYFLLLVQYQLILVEFWLVLVIHLLIFHDVTAMKLLNDSDSDPETTEKEFSESECNMQLDGKRICTFHRSFLPFFA